MKLFAKKADPGRYFREMDDIRQLCRLQDIDHAEVRGYFDKYGRIEDYEKLIKDGPA